MHLLVTRPEPDGERTAQVLRQRGHAVTLAPVLRREIIRDAQLGSGSYAAVVMTSAHAPRAIARHPGRAALLGLPAFTVGERTADAAQTAGFANVMSADGGLPELAWLLFQKMAPGRVLYLAAADRAGDLAGALGAHGFRVDTVVVYRMMPDPGLADALPKILSQRPDGVLHYSRRSAELFLAAAEAAGARPAVLKPTHYCLSDTIAAPLRRAGASVKVAAQPDEAALLALLEP